jgi:hypothetical protein
MARMSVTKRELLEKREFKGFITENEEVLLRYFEIDNLLQKINRRANKETFQEEEIEKIHDAFDELVKACEDIL